MYEQVAKDHVQERLKQGVASQQVHLAIARQEKGFSFGARIASWFTRHNASMQPRSQGDLAQKAELDNLVTSEETALKGEF